MSKQFRGATQTRRGVRGGYPEHDDFEGLPVRQWRQEWVSMAPPPPPDMTQQNDRWAPELPFGMPKEYALLQPHSQELLRAARSGRLYKRPPPAEEDDADADAADGKGDKRELDLAAGGYAVKVWKQSSRNVEDISHLAKRHKNTVVLASKALAPLVVRLTMRRVTVRRTDAAGNPYEQTVMLEEGQTVDGEIVSESMVPVQVDSSGEMVVQQPQARRRPPPPKRKAKGPGRGRKKKMGVTLPLPRPPTTGDTSENSADVRSEADGPDGVKSEEADGSTNPDMEMADASAVLSDDDEGDEGDDADEEGEEGEEGGDEDVASSSLQDLDQDQEMADSESSSEIIRPSSIEEPEETPRILASEDEDITIPKPRFTPPLGLGPLHPPAHLTSPRIEGSPLKNVVIQSPTDPSPPTTASLAAATSMETSTSKHASSSEANVTERVSPIAALDGTEPAVQSSASGTREASRVQDTVPDTAEEPQVTPAPAPANADEMLDQKKPNVSPPPTIEIVELSESPPEPQAMPASPTTPKPEPVESQPAVPEPPKSPNLRPTATADDADGVNLLSSLETELTRQETLSGAASSAGDPKTPTPPAVEPAADDAALGPGDSIPAPVELQQAAETTDPSP